MFISNIGISFHLWWKENLLKHQRSQNIMKVVVATKLRFWRTVLAKKRTMCTLPEKMKKALRLRLFYRTFLFYLFQYNFKLLIERNFFYTQKTSFDTRLSSRSNYISKNIFSKNHSIHAMLFICTRVFKFNKSFFLSFRKINVKKVL